MSDQQPWQPADVVPFDDSISTVTWTFGSGDRIQIESSPRGFYVSGRVGGKDWHDEDHEDFYLPTSNDLLDFLRQHGLLSVLSKKG